MNLNDLRIQIQQDTDLSAHEAHITAYRCQQVQGCSRGSGRITGQGFTELARKIQAAQPDLSFRQAKRRAAGLLRQGM